MKRWVRVLVGFYALYGVLVFAEGPIEATTESGKQVILYTDGTWAYTAQKPLPMSQGYKFSRSTEATEKAALMGGRYALFFNPQKWKHYAVQEQGRLAWRHREGDGYAMVLQERIEIPLGTLRNIALANAQEAAPDAQVTFEGKRQVNGTELLCLQIKGTIQGVAFTYLGYYYSSNYGTVQILTYTAQNLFEEFQNEFEEFLNGFAVIDDEGSVRASQTIK
jgi:hypothetical protein